MGGELGLIPVTTRVIGQKDDLVDVLLKALDLRGTKLENEDIIVVASKVVALVEGRVRKASEVRVSKRASDLATRLAVDQALMQLILDESEVIYEGCSEFVLTVRKGFPCVNACIDAANAPEGSFILPPINADESAHRMREDIRAKTGRKVAVVVADSGLLPGRRGTIGVALGFAGLKPSKNYIGKKDLYGRPLRVTFQSVVDDIASAAKLLMGEADERVPFVIVRGAPVKFTDERIAVETTLLPSDTCVFMSNTTKRRRTEKSRPTQRSDLGSCLGEKSKRDIPRPPLHDR
jgi:coenzyme F420-0:L-glutamate ligase